jgi:hypothetical protein
MPVIGPGFGLPQLNGALAAGQKLGRGEALSRAERGALAALQSLPRANDQIDADPTLRTALLTALGGPASPVPLLDNPVLASGLVALRQKSSVGAGDLAQLVAFAGRLSHAEDAAITATATYLRLSGAMSAETYAGLDALLAGPRAERGAAEQKASWVRRALTALGAGVVGTVATTLAFWLFGAPVAADVGAQAAQAVQLGLTAGGLLAGAGGGALVGMRWKRQADDFGVKELG